MSRPLVRGLLYGALLLAFVLHNDLWLWNEARLVAGLPIGLAYHVVFCLAVAGLLWALVRFAWPQDLDGDPSLRDEANR